MRSTEEADRMASICVRLRGVIANALDEQPLTSV
jgi:hypothetical protein